MHNNKLKNGILVLEDGTKFVGKSFGYEKSQAGEIVFSTSFYLIFKNFCSIKDPLLFCSYGCVSTLRYVTCDKGRMLRDV